MKKTYGDQEALSLIDHDENKKSKLFFDLCPQPIALISKKGRFLRVNQALCKFLEYSDVELCDKTFTEITHPEDIGVDWANLKKLERGESDTYSMVKRYLTKNMEVVKLLLTVYPFRDQHGNIILYVSHIVPYIDNFVQKDNSLNDVYINKNFKEKTFDFVFEYWYQILVAAGVLIATALFFIDFKNKIERNHLITEEAIESTEKLAKIVKSLTQEKNNEPKSNTK